MDLFRAYPLERIQENICEISTKQYQSHILETNDIASFKTRLFIFCTKLGIMTCSKLRIYIEINIL